MVKVLRATRIRDCLLYSRRGCALRMRLQHPYITLLCIDGHSHTWHSTAHTLACTPTLARNHHYWACGDTRARATRNFKFMEKKVILVEDTAHTHTHTTRCRVTSPSAFALIPGGGWWILGGDAWRDSGRCGGIRANDAIVAILATRRQGELCWAVVVVGTMCVLPTHFVLSASSPLYTLRDAPYGEVFIAVDERSNRLQNTKRNRFNAGWNRRRKLINLAFVSNSLNISNSFIACK